jgi:hypothetical protein
MPSTTPPARPTRPVEELDRKPRPVAHLVQTFCLPGSLDAVTIEMIVTASGAYQRVDAEVPVVMFDAMPESREAGWRGFGSDDLDIQFRVIH